jgi:hypothetical protein
MASWAAALGRRNSAGSMCRCAGPRIERCRSVCLYYESSNSSCAGPGPSSWHCDAGSTTLAECQANHEGDGFCDYGCCFRWYYSYRQIFQGTCDEALASKGD